MVEITKEGMLKKQKVCMTTPLLSARTHMHESGWCEGCPGLAAMCHYNLKNVHADMRRTGLDRLAETVAKNLSPIFTR